MANEGEKKAMVTGFFGEYGGQFIPEALEKRLDELDAAFRDAMADTAFHEEYLKQEVADVAPLDVKDIARVLCRGG